MFKNKLTIIITSVIVIFFLAVIIYSSIDFNKPSANSVNPEMKIVDVDKVVENPENFTGIVSVEGTVTEVTDNNKYFTLGCEDACISLPVAYNGDMPKIESNIVALGEIKKDDDGKFFFDAREIKYKWRKRLLIQ